MAKYDAQLTELKNLLLNSKNILIALPANSSIDTLASGLALFLTLEALGKQVSVSCDDDIKVGQSHLFGVDHIQKNLPPTDGGNLTLTLEGVAASDNTIPALEKLDWYAKDNNLNLVFHILPNQTFQPRQIVPHYQGSGFNLIFVVGAANLNALGNIYSSNSQAFSGTHVVNIDTQPTNTSFGQTNVLDTNASSLSEMMGSVITDLGFNLSPDVATNLLTGIFDTTNSLTNQKASAETFMVVGNLLKAGGRKPQAPISGGSVQTGAVPTTPAYDWSALMPQQPAPQPASIPISQPVFQPVPSQPAPEYTVPPVISPQPAPAAQPTFDHGDDYAPANQSTQQQTQASGSPEERPSGEGVISETVEPEWLTPKIFKGSSIG